MLELMCNSIMYACISIMVTQKWPFLKFNPTLSPQFSWDHPEIRHILTKQNLGQKLWGRIFIIRSLMGLMGLNVASRENWYSSVFQKRRVKLNSCFSSHQFSFFFGVAHTDCTHHWGSNSQCVESHFGGEFYWRPASCLAASSLATSWWYCMGSVESGRPSGDWLQ